LLLQRHQDRVFSYILHVVKNKGHYNHKARPLYRFRQVFRLDIAYSPQSDYRLLSPRKGREYSLVG
jgi:hypothetical protein